MTEVPDELWLPVRRLVVLRVWRLARAGLGPCEVGERLGMSEAAVRRVLEELRRYAVPPVQADGTGDGRWVHCYYLSAVELERYRRLQVQRPRPNRPSGAREP